MKVSVGGMMVLDSLSHLVLSGCCFYWQPLEADGVRTSIFYSRDCVALSLALSICVLLLLSLQFLLGVLASLSVAFSFLE